MNAVQTLLDQSGDAAEAAAWIRVSTRGSGPGGTRPDGITPGGRRRPGSPGGQRAALGQLSAARAADWRDVGAAQAAWAAVQDSEARLLAPTDTLAGVSGKLAYLLKLAETQAGADKGCARQSWRYRLLLSAKQDADRLEEAPSRQRYERLRVEFHRCRTSLTDVEEKLAALTAELQACQRQLELARHGQVRPNPSRPGALRAPLGRDASRLMPAAPSHTA